MRILKRIGNFLLAAVMFLSSIPSYAYEFDSYSEKNYALFSERQQLFMSLGVLDEAKNAEDLVTRAEFAHITVKFFGFDSSAFDGSGSLTDIAAEKYAKDIECVCAEGLMTPIDGTLFYPSDPINVKDLARAAVCSLGYEYAARNKYGNKDDSYIPMGRELKLFKGIEEKESVYAVKYIELMQVLENLLETDYLKAYTKKGKVEFHTAPGNNVMNSVFKIERRFGIVTATPMADLYGNGEAPEDFVRIDGEEYRCAADTENMLGYRVKYYYSQDEEEVLYICADSERNRELVLQDEDIEGYSGRRYKYIGGSGKSKTIELPAGCAVIYNGRANTGKSSIGFNMKPANGTVKFIDNDTDGKYEVVIIEDYVSIVAGTVDKTGMTIYDKFDNTLKCSIYDIDEKYISVTSGEGKEISFNNIKAGNVISVFQSIDKTRTMMIVSSKKADGVVRQLGEDFAVIDDEKYEFAGDIRGAEDIKAGKKVTAYIDYRGKIVYFEQKNETVEAVYLINAGFKKRSEKIELKFCNSSGVVENADCAEKLYVDDIKQKNHSDALKLLCDPESDAPLPQILTVTRSEEGEIKRIYRVWSGDKSDCPPEALMLNSTLTDTSLKYIAANSIFMDYKTALSSNCKIFFIPSDLENTDDFLVLTASELKDDQSYGYNTNPFYAYTLGGDSVLCGYAVTAASLSPRRSSSYGIIKNVKYVYDEEKDEVCTEVDMYYTGEGSVRFYDDAGIDIEHIPPHTASVSSDTYSLTPGDLILYNYSVENGRVLMTSASMIYDYETKKYLSVNPSTTNTKESVFYLANVWKKASGYLALSVDSQNSQYSNPKDISSAFNSTAQNYRVENVGAASVYRADGSAKNIVSVDFADIVDYGVSESEYSKMIVMSKLGRATCCYIIN